VRTDERVFVGRRNSEDFFYVETDYNVHVCVCVCGTWTGDEILSAHIENPSEGEDEPGGNQLQFNKPNTR